MTQPSHNTANSASYQWLVHAPINRVLLQMTSPMVLAIFLLFGYDVLESQLLSHISLEALTALGFTVPITTAMVAIAVAITITTNTAVTQTISQNKDQAPSVIINSIVVGLLVSSILACFAYLLNTPIFRFLGIDYAMLPDSFHLGPRPKLLPLIENYMVWRYVGWVFLVLIWQINSLLRSLGHIGYASGLFVAWMLSKFGLALVLFSNIMGVEGMSNMAVAEVYQLWMFKVSPIEIAALIHLLCDALFALISVWFLAKKLNITSLASIPIEPLKAMKKMSVVGLPATLQQLFTPISITLLTVFVVSYGQVYVAVLGIVFRLEALLLLLPMVLTTALPSIVGVNWWSGHSDRVKAVLFTSKVLVLFSQLAIAFALVFYGPVMASWFSEGQHIQHSIENYLRIVPLGYIGAGIVIICQSSFNATGHFIKATVLSFAHRLVLMSACCWIGLQLHGIEGLFFGILCAHLLAAALAVLLNRRIHRME
ncbi:MAG: Na+-driven multidrug efflux pump [Phenylobacterium sp.]|jgi:Na+-driven multidrug efflux pump